MGSTEIRSDNLAATVHTLDLSHETIHFAEIDDSVVVIPLVRRGVLLFKFLSVSTSPFEFAYNDLCEVINFLLSIE